MSTAARARSSRTLDGPSRAPARAMFKAIGLTDAAESPGQDVVRTLDRPISPSGGVDLPDIEIDRRLADRCVRPTRYPTGVLARYARLVSSAAVGAVLE
jgi:hypothetical protein